MAGCTKTMYGYVAALLLALVDIVNCQCASNIPCFAPAVDVAHLPDAVMTANATCGEPPEQFCVGTDCSLLCDASGNQTWHPASFLIDDFELMTYWKSKNFVEPVFIQIDLGFELILHQITLTFPFDELPLALYIQSSRGIRSPFKTLVFFALRCLDTFGMQESITYNGTRTLCFRIDSLINQVSYAPRRDEHVAVEVLKGGAVRNYFVFSSVRIVLHEFFKPSDFDASVADPRRFYFAVQDMDIQASCECNGMANQCSGDNYGTCVCQKNTEGTRCERCMALYNNKPWRFGIACEFCNCNNHADRCVYDARLGTGVCMGCEDNTAGYKCESCVQGFYLNASLPATDPEICVACNCLPAGVQSGLGVCNPLTGFCYCKANVQGQQCGLCKDGFWGLSETLRDGCSPCSCAAYGSVGSSTVCEKSSGQCPCKAGFAGRTCSGCLSGYYGHPANSITECRPCDCHPSGSHNMTCSTSGQCHCRPTYFGTKCEQISPGYYSASVAQLQWTAMAALISSPAPYHENFTFVTDSRGHTFYVMGYILRLGAFASSQPTTVTFSITIPALTVYEFFLQYATRYEFATVSMRVQRTSNFVAYSCDAGLSVINPDTAFVMLSSLSPRNDTQSFGLACLSAGTYSVLVSFEATSAGALSAEAQIHVCSLLALPMFEYSAYYRQVGSVTQELIRRFYSSASSLSAWATREQAGATYLAYLYGNLFTSSYACGCSRFGTINPTVCNIYGGQCNCLPRIYGRTCSNCVPGYYNFTSGLGCAACDCDSVGSFNGSCNLISGQCPCKPSVVNRRCNQCALNHHGIQSGTGCTPCGCSPLFSMSPQCDESGQCWCKPGIGSRKCTACLPGYYELNPSGCTPCACNPIGTLNNLCSPLSGSCGCKANVVGLQCEQCKHGYFGYSSEFPAACLACHCSGKATECDVASGFRLTNVSSMFFTRTDNVRLEGWQSVNRILQPAGDLFWDWAPAYSVERGFAKVLDTAGGDLDLFFQAPAAFLGDKRTAYMLYLSFDMTQSNSSAPARPSSTGDVIIQGVGLGFKLVTNLTKHPDVYQKFTRYEVRFDEQRWYRDFLGGPRPSSDDMIMTLENLEILLIRAKWVVGTGQFSGLANVVLSFGAFMPGSSLTPLRSVEYCDCPVPFSGQFCQFCSRGYTRLPRNGGRYDNCVPCECNNHTPDCDRDSGVCLSCLHNTMGEQCEKCMQGYYGDATRGQPDDCKPCPCPGGASAPNQFSNTCVLDNDEQPTCIRCAVGYTGRRCEVCADGYYGRPQERLGSCKPCACNNNIDRSVEGNCNTTSGECLRCLFNTIGANCEWCRPGFFGFAPSQSCQGCTCNLVGAVGPVCHNMTGQCSCKRNVVGRVCSQCAENTFNFQSGNGCELCNCNVAGSASLQCDQVTGNCVCKERMVGPKCSKCAPGFYDISRGCLPCNCNQSFTVPNTTCDDVTGQCMCTDSNLGGKYGGRTCSECGANAIGRPPKCELCHSPCYDNWQKYIAQEALDIQDLQLNVTDMLEEYGGLSYADIQGQLAAFNANLSFAAGVFAGAQYDVEAMEKQFRMIETRIIDFEAILNQGESQFLLAKQFFETTVLAFNGSVLLSSAIPHPILIPVITVRIRRNAAMYPVFVDSALVTSMSQGYITRSHANNRTGLAVYVRILDQYGQIRLANGSLATASAELVGAIGGLAIAAAERARVAAILNDNFTRMYQSNGRELMRIHDVVRALTILQNQTAQMNADAAATVKSAQTVIGQAEAVANSRKDRAQLATQLAGQVHLDAAKLKESVVRRQQDAENLKNKANAVLFDVQQEVAKVATAINDIARIREGAQLVLNRYQEVMNLSLPVSIAQVQSLATQIINTPVDEAQINQTYAGAQVGLRQAQSVQTLADQAVAVSQAALIDIKALDQALVDVEHLRLDTVRLQEETDSKVQGVLNITATMRSRFGSVQDLGVETLALITSTMQELQSSLPCFSDAKGATDEATGLANQARNVAADAMTIHRSNERDLLQYAPRINAKYEETFSAYQLIQDASRNATQLLSDVTEAERLLTQLNANKSELEALQAEHVSLDVELTDLIQKYESAVDAFADCANV